MRIKNNQTVVIDTILHTPNPSREGRQVTTSSINRLGVATNAISSPLERGGGVLLLLVALLALLFTSCEATDAISEQEIPIPLRLSASLEQSGIATRATDNLQILAGGRVILTIDGVTKSFKANAAGELVPFVASDHFTLMADATTVSFSAYGTLMANVDQVARGVPVIAISDQLEIATDGQSADATIAFRPATALISVNVEGTSGDTHLSDFRISGAIFGMPAKNGAEYVFDSSGNLMHNPTGSFSSGTVVEAVPFTVAPGDLMFSLRQINPSGAYYMNSYQVTNTSGKPFVAEAGHHYSINVRLLLEGDPVVLITDITTRWNIEPEKTISTVGNYDYMISSAADLISFRNRVNSGQTALKGIQAADITLSEEWTPIGSEEKIFVGVYNGNGYTINNLSIDSDKNDCALFGVIGPGAVLTGIHLNRVDVSTTGFRAAALAARGLGSEENPATITLCSANGKLESNRTLGGLVGYALHTNISRSHAAVELIGYANGILVGGIAGMLSHGIVFGCSADVDITSPISTSGDILGGIVGHMTEDASSVTFSYAVGSLASTAIANSKLGGLVGVLSKGKTTRSYASVTLPPKPAGSKTLFYGALVGDVATEGSLTYCNADLAQSGASDIIGANLSTVVENNTTTLPDRLNTVSRTPQGLTIGLICRSTTVWSPSGYGIVPSMRRFSTRYFWTDETSPKIIYTYNGDAMN